MSAPLITLEQVLAALEQVTARVGDHICPGGADSCIALHGTGEALLRNLQYLVDREVLRRKMLSPHGADCAAGQCTCARGEP